MGDDDGSGVSLDGLLCDERGERERVCLGTDLPYFPPAKKIAVAP